MAEAPKVEVTSREAMLAVGFVFLTILAVALVQAGVITNPLTLGLMVTLTIGLIFVGHFMTRAGVISRSALPLWYIFTFGVVMLVYGHPVGLHTGGVHVFRGVGGGDCVDQRHVLHLGRYGCRRSSRNGIRRLQVLQETRSKHGLKTRSGEPKH